MILKNEREKQTYKDEAMSTDSDFSFVIWDGKSKGSFANILRAINSNKFAKVYYIFEERFQNKPKSIKMKLSLFIVLITAIQLQKLQSSFKIKELKNSKKLKT